jgi:hypothetical protein
MATKKFDRGLQITYYQIPQDCYDKILEKKLQLGKEKKRSISLSEAITKIIRGK